MESLRRFAIKKSNSEGKNTEPVKVGFCRRFHGLKGSVVVSVLTDFPEERFLPGSRLLLVPPAESVSELVVAECSDY